MSEEELINTYNQKKYDEALKEIEDKEFSSMLENYKKIVQISFEEYQDLTKEEPKENFQYMVHKMANEDIKIFESLELKDKLIKLQEQEIDKYKIILDNIKYNNKRIIDYGFDYDGFNNVEDLKKLIDMLLDYARKNYELLEGIE